MSLEMRESFSSAAMRLSDGLALLQNPLSLFLILPEIRLGGLGFELRRGDRDGGVRQR